MSGGQWILPLWLVIIPNLTAVCQTASVFMVKMKKCSKVTQTLRAGCSKVEPKIFAPLQTPFPGVWDGQNLISWRWRGWWGSMHAISSYRGNRPTNKHTHRQGRLQYTAPLASAQCNHWICLSTNRIVCGILFSVVLRLLLLLLLLTMYWFKWRCHANDAGALYRVIITVRKVIKS